VKNYHPKVNLILIFLITIGFICCIGESLLAIDLTKEIEVKKYHPKLESVLGRLVEKYSQGKVVAQDFARKRKIPFEDDEVRVILVPPVGEDVSVINRAKLVSYRVAIEAISKHLMRVKVPVYLLEKIANEVDGISYIRLPCKPFSDMVTDKAGLNLPNSLEERENSSKQVTYGITSEGVALTKALDYHNSGYKGQNTKVAIIDIGFNNLTNSQTNGELPENVITKDFTGTGIETGRTHGTGVAEIIYDMAPQSQLYLIKVGDEVDLENAKDYCIEQGVDIINHSWLWPNTNFTDGTGLICDIANDAGSNGILWINAAGNAAYSHYQGFFVDTDRDGWHEFSAGDETNPIHYYGNLTIYLTWNNWPVTDQDYDLYLYDSNFKLVASSTTRQTGNQEPTEKISFNNAAGNYYIGINKYNASGDQELKIISFFGAGTLGYQTPEHSICAPADAVGAMAVGYINIDNWETGPQGSSSSQGPTNDERIKPDIMGPSNIASFTWGRGNYTSAATPHVSGAASLILSRYPSSTISQVRSVLESWAVDMGDSEKDNVYGSGRLKLLLKPSFVFSLNDLTVYPNPFKFSKGYPGIVFDNLTLDARVRIFTISGELVVDSGEIKEWGRWVWNLKNNEGKEAARGIYVYLITDSSGERRIGKIVVIKR